MLILSGVVGGSFLLRTLLHNPFFSYVGRLSYSLYLVHMPVQFYVVFPALAGEKGLHALESPSVWGAIVASLVCMWLISECTYRSVEKPFLCLKPVLTGADRQSGSSGDKR